MNDELPDDWLSRMKDLVADSSKWRHEEKVMLVNCVMYDKLCAALTHRDYPVVNAYGMRSPLTINFMSGAVEVHTIGPLQYSLYGKMNPDTSALLLSKDTWELMCGKGPLWRKFMERLDPQVLTAGIQSVETGDPS